MRDLAQRGVIRFSFDVEQFYGDTFMFVAALYDPSASGRLWARATVDFELSGREQPTPEEFCYLLAPCRNYEHRPLAESER
jgi:hypothetical protein